jgi:dihydrofolate reductase
MDGYIIMRKLKLQMHISLDGFAATTENGPINDIYWDDEIRNYCIANLENVDLILLGHNTAPDFIPFWAATADKPDDPEYEVGRLLTDIPKLVFSKTATESKWPNTTMASGDLVQTITRLKKQEGKTMLVYGGVSFVASLISAGLIDEYGLLKEPVGLGSGKPIFKQPTSLELVKTILFTSGLVVLQYVPKS